MHRESLVSDVPFKFSALIFSVNTDMHTSISGEIKSNHSVPVEKSVNENLQ